MVVGADLQEEICRCIGRVSGRGAQEKTRTSTTFRPQVPETCASANSATWATEGAIVDGYRPKSTGFACCARHLPGYMCATTKCKTLGDKLRPAGWRRGGEWRREL